MGHCPADGLRTVAGPAPPPSRSIEYVACPRCGRAFSKESKFCSVDRELLLPYGMAMNDFRARRRNEPVPRERMCIKCGSRQPGTSVFCPREGEALR